MGGTTKAAWRAILAAATVGTLLTLAATETRAQARGDGVARPPDAIVGTGGGDTLVGTERSDYIDALRGDDVLVGRGSYDYLQAGEGNDVAAGGEGDDYFVADAPGVGLGPDGIDRAGGDDVLHRGPGADVINGDAGADTLVGGGGADELLTDDPIEGDSVGDDARDLVSGGGGGDFVNAEDGRGLAADVIGCGAGRGTVLAHGADRVSPDCEVVR